MKQVLLPIFALILLVACNKETPTEQVDAPTQEEILIPNASFETPTAKDYLAQLSSINQADFNSESLILQRNGGSQTSKEAVRNLAEDQITCQDESGHSVITRKDNGVHISYHAKGLTPGETYLIYVLVENYDESCFPDFSGGFLSFIDAIILGEQVANASGKINLTTFVENGDNTNSWYGPLGYGIVDSYQSNLFVYTRIGEIGVGAGVDLQVSPHVACISFFPAPCS